MPADPSGNRSVPGGETAPVRLADLAELLGGESPRSRQFLGGLVAGALAGAALAGFAAARRRARTSREG
jgi:hypothetical protein